MSPTGPGVDMRDNWLGEGRSAEERAHLCRLVLMKVSLYLMAKRIDPQTACDLV